MLYVSEFQAACFAVVGLVLGLCVGSFVNCAAMRRNTGESVLWGRSHCTSCGETLKAHELIPLFSWFAQGGACRHCGAAISARYLLVEAICGLSFALIIWAQAHSFLSLSPRTVELLILTALLLYAALVDLDSRVIPNGVIVAALVVHAVYIVVAGPLMGIIDAFEVLKYSLIGAFALSLSLLVVVLIADHVFGRESMGGGDLKLFFVAGLYFGWQQGLFLLIAACFIGIATAFIPQKVVTGKAQEESVALRSRQIPFGPAITAACVLTMLVGQDLILWYAGLF